VGDRFVEMATPWMRLIGEHILTPQGLLDYWRVEKADSLIILPVQGDRLLLPPPQYRPGVGRATWDLPGGRCPPARDRQTVALEILHRELGLGPGAIAHLQPLTDQGWAINSSFSNQQLHALVAQIQPGPIPHLGRAYGIPQDWPSLMTDITCLQCRCVLHEWRAQEAAPFPDLSSPLE
jgi:hypothetical protein